jgi:hypothetical protein
MRERFSVSSRTFLPGNLVAFAQLSIEETEDDFEKRIHVGKCESKAVTLKKGTVLSVIRTGLER